MHNSETARLVLIQTVGLDGPAIVSDWVASTAWSLPGVRLDEVYPSAGPGAGWVWAATTPGSVDPMRRIADADAVVIVMADDGSRRMRGLEALVGGVGEHWRGKPVALVYPEERTGRQLDQVVVRLRGILARASLEAVCFPAQGPRLDACGCTSSDSPETRALRRMFGRLLCRIRRRGSVVARSDRRAVA